MKAGVTRSVSPNHSAITSGSPSASFDTAAMPLGLKFRIVGRIGPEPGGKVRIGRFEPTALHPSTHVPITPAIPHARVGYEASCLVPVRCPERGDLLVSG